MQWLAIYGCAGGDLLVGAKASGMLTACSFAAPVDERVDGIGDYWQRDDAFGPFRLDASQRRIERDGSPLQLSGRAFDILLALVRQAGNVVSKVGVAGGPNAGIAWVVHPLHGPGRRRRRCRRRLSLSPLQDSSLSRGGRSQQHEEPRFDRGRASQSGS